MPGLNSIFVQMVGEGHMDLEIFVGGPSWAVIREAGRHTSGSDLKKQDAMNEFGFSAWHFKYTIRFTPSLE